MSSHGWFSKRNNGSVWWAVAAIAASGVCWGVSVEARSETTFQRLRQLDREVERHRRASERARRALQRAREPRDAADTGDVERHLQLRLEARAARRLAGPARLHRKVARRVPFWSPGRGSDLRRLLQFAERRALAADRELYSTLGRLQPRRSGASERQLRDRAQTAIELAQHRASARAKSAEQEEVVERARERDRTELERELDASQQQLEQTLNTLIDNETGSDFHRKKGTLLPPVDREPDQGFGEKKQDDSMTYVRHTGLSYRVDEGTDVRAATGGLVVFARRFEGYGKLVIVDHGDAYHTLYAHLREIAVEEGDKLERGSRLGTSGARESLDGAKLYFELRKDGAPIDPEPWFIRRK